MSPPDKIDPPSHINDALNTNSAPVTVDVTVNVNEQVHAVKHIQQVEVEDIHQFNLVQESKPATGADPSHTSNQSSKPSKVTEPTTSDRPTTPVAARPDQKWRLPLYFGVGNWRRQGEESVVTSVAPAIVDVCRVSELRTTKSIIFLLLTACCSLTEHAVRRDYALGLWVWCCGSAAEA
ncbi:unnamed protein product [Penicillium pancosmium]